MSKYSISALIISFCFLFSCGQQSNQKIESSLANQFEKSIEKVAETWYPRVLDFENGGFHSNFDKDWAIENKSEKMIVTQARNVWSLASLYELKGDPKFLDWAAHGISFLLDTLWDKEHGGFHDNALLDPKNGYSFSSGKTAYGNAFAIYGLSTYFKVSNDSTALTKAIETFDWLNDHSYDSKMGGYFNILRRDGIPVFQNKAKIDFTGNNRQALWKDMNSSIHLLEAFTSLYQVWPHSLVKDKIEELLDHLLNRIFHDEGYMSLFFERDWKPVSYLDSAEKIRNKYIYFDHVSFGHDVETTFLMLEAAHSIGHHNENLKSFCQKIVDHALDNGWDEKSGGFYDYGYYFSPEECQIIRPDKVWWTQAEGLNALLLMYKLSNDQKYWEYFSKQWNYINTHLIDPKTGTWYSDGTDADPSTIEKPKAHIWKGNYHNLRALINCKKMLDGNFELTRK